MDTLWWYFVGQKSMAYFCSLIKPVYVRSMGTSMKIIATIHYSLMIDQNYFFYFSKKMPNLKISPKNRVSL